MIIFSKNPLCIGWSVKLAFKEIRITSHTFGQKIYIFMVSRTLIFLLRVTLCAGHNINLPSNSSICSMTSAVSVKTKVL